MKVPCRALVLKLTHVVTLPIVGAEAQPESIRKSLRHKSASHATDYPSGMQLLYSDTSFAKKCEYLAGFGQLKPLRQFHLCLAGKSHEEFGNKSTSQVKIQPTVWHMDTEHSWIAQQEGSFQLVHIIQLAEVHESVPNSKFMPKMDKESFDSISCHSFLSVSVRLSEGSSLGCSLNRSFLSHQIPRQKRL